MRRLAWIALPLFLACTEGAPPKDERVAQPPVRSPLPRVSVDPETVYFDPAYAGFAATQPLTLLNAGNEPLEFALSATPPFSVSTTTIGVPASSVAEVQLRFEPTAHGRAQGTLRVTWPGGDREVLLQADVRAPPSCTSPDACVASRYDPGTDRCVDLPLADGTSCGSGDCAAQPVCRAGACVDVQADDGAACKTDAGVGICSRGSCYGPPEELDQLVVRPAAGVFEAALALDAHGNAYYIERSSELGERFLLSSGPFEAQRFRVPLPQRRADAMLFAADAAELMVVDGLVFVWGPIVGAAAFDTDDGRLLWHLGDEGFPRGAQLHGAAEVPGGIALVVGEEVFLLGPSGEVRWRRPVGANAPADRLLADAQGTLYYAEGGVTALDPATNAVRWNVMEPSDPRQREEPVAVANGLLLTARNPFDAVRRTSDGLSLAAEYADRCSRLTGPVIVDGTLVRASCAGNAVAGADPASLQMSWHQRRGALREDANGFTELSHPIATNRGSLLVVSARCDGSVCESAFLMLHEIGLDGALRKRWTLPRRREHWSLPDWGTRFLVQGEMLYTLDAERFRLFRMPGYGAAPHGWTSPRGNNQASMRER